MLNDAIMKKPVKLSFCLSTYEMYYLYKCLSSRYIRIFMKIFNLHFLSYHGDFDLSNDIVIGFTDYGLVKNVNDLDFRTFSAVNAEIFLTKSNCRSLVSLIHNLNLIATKQALKGEYVAYLDLERLAHRFTKSLFHL